MPWKTVQKPLVVSRSRERTLPTAASIRAASGDGGRARPEAGVGKISRRSAPAGPAGSGSGRGSPAGGATGAQLATASTPASGSQKNRLIRTSRFAAGRGRFRGGLGRVNARRQPLPPPGDQHPPLGGAQEG